MPELRCDCCGRVMPCVRRCWPVGVGETWACHECKGEEIEDCPECGEEAEETR